LARNRLVVDFDVIWVQPGRPHWGHSTHVDPDTSLDMNQQGQEKHEWEQKHHFVDHLLGSIQFTAHESNDLIEAVLKGTDPWKSQHFESIPRTRPENQEGHGACQIKDKLAFDGIIVRDALKVVYEYSVLDVACTELENYR
jgi:hypothetical protein